MCIPAIILRDCFVEKSLEQGGGFRVYCRNSDKRHAGFRFSGALGAREEQTDLKIFWEGESTGNGV